MRERTGLITGSTRGIGLGIADALAREGWHLIVNGVRSENEVSGVLERLGRFGVRISYARGDVGSAEGRARVLEVAWRAASGAIHLLVNNAGVAPTVRADLLEMSEESYDRVVRTNLKGAVFLTQAVARQMVEARRASEGYQAAIVNISSVSATVASVKRAEYCISKAGLSMATQLFAARLGEFGIPVYEVRPGVIRTDMTDAVADKYDALIAQGLCVQARWGVPSDVGRAVAALARGDFPYSTGQVVLVDGGLTLARL